MIRIKRGLDLPIAGAPNQHLIDSKKVQRIGVTADDYVGMKPSMAVKVGDVVKKGQLLFSCKKSEGVLYTSPAAGKVVEINRGERRVFQSLVIEVAENEESVSFQNFSGKNSSDLSREEVTSLLVESGLWTGLRTRPFSKVPSIKDSPAALFINAMDSNPLSIDPNLPISKHLHDFKCGVEVLSKLTEGTTYVCKAPGTKVEVAGDNVVVEEFIGPHPAGNTGTHIHFLSPVHAGKTVWSMGYADVIAVGRLFITGKLYTDRLVALCGPQANNPRLIETRVGADLNAVAAGESLDGETRVISGSVFNGRKSFGPFTFLGRHHNQVTLMKEGRERELLGWQGPGWDKFSVKETFASSILKGKLFSFTTNCQGSKRAMVPVGSYEKIMPLDILPTQLLRTLVTKDTDSSQALGCLELDEEDLALCTFVSPGKVNFGPLLRENLTTIEKEG